MYSRFIFVIPLMWLSAVVSADDTALPVYRPVACPFNYPAAQCATAILTEDRSAQRGQVSIPIVQLGSGNGKPPAVVLGGGGPGGGLYLDNESAIIAWDMYRTRILGEDGKLILIDQRGAGLSRPLLNCPEEKPLLLSLLEQPRSAREESEMWQQAMRQCYTRLINSGVQVDAYTTAASVNDIEDIRRLLNIDTWHIIGFSYATRLALELLRHYPESVASAVLDSPVPYDVHQIRPFYPFAAVVTLIDAHCRRQSGCRRHGETSDNIIRALTRAKTNPLTIVQSYNSTLYNIVLSPQRLIALLHNGVYHEDGAAVLPFFSRQLAQGDIDNANAEYFAYSFLDFYLTDALASMLNWTINCRESRHSPPPPKTALQQHEHLFWREYINICNALWPDPPPPPEIVTSHKPVLIINGIYDPVTPPAWGSVLKRRLSAAQHIIVPAAHAPSFALPCLQDAVYSFFQSPSATITPGCPQLTFY